MFFFVRYCLVAAIVVEIDEQQVTLEAVPWTIPLRSAEHVCANVSDAACVPRIAEALTQERNIALSAWRDRVRNSSNSCARRCGAERRGDAGVRSSSVCVCHGNAVSPPPQHPAFDFARDMLVHVHIPRTGGTSFARQLAGAAPATHPCHDQFGAEKWAHWQFCPKQGVDLHAQHLVWGSVVRQWLLSRLTGQFFFCGIHPSLDRLRTCLRAVQSDAVVDRVDAVVGALPRSSSGGRTLFVTRLRHPVERFLSEMDNTWHGYADVAPHDALNAGESAVDASDFWCDGTARHDAFANCSALLSSPRLLASPLSRSNSADRNVRAPRSLPYFLHCAAAHRSPAADRQVRMLGRSRCAVRGEGGRDHEHSTAAADDDEALLASAKEELLHLAHFSLLEYSAQSECLFEATFGVPLGKAARRAPDAAAFRKHRARLSPAEERLVEEVNSLDMQLYRFAVEEFERRLAASGGACGSLSPQQYE